MNTLFFILIGYFICNAVIKYLSWYVFSNEQKKWKNLKYLKTYNNCYFIIPVFKEENVIDDAYTYAKKILQKIKGIQIVFVGTERENPNITLTKLKKLNNDERIIILSATKSRKYMAGQLNYAIKYIDKIKKNKLYNVAIYNVDSRPSISSIRKNFSMLLKHPVVQQYGSYFNNCPLDINSFHDMVYLSIFLWQSSWAKQFEIRNVLWNRINPLKIFSKFSYVVGHGLFLRRYVFDKTGFFTEKFQNEDMEFSMRLHKNDIPIASGVDFSDSDMPLTLKDYIKQQSVWARGPMMAFKYLSTIFSFTIPFKLFLHYVYWLTEPLMMLVLFISSFFLSIYHLLFTAFIFFIYFYVVLILPNIEQIKKIKFVFNPVKIYFSFICFFLIHAIGPVLALKNVFLESAKLKNEEKFKTPKEKKHEIS